MRRDNKGEIFSGALSLAQHIEPANLISSEQDCCPQYQTSVPSICPQDLPTIVEVIRHVDAVHQDLG